MATGNVHSSCWLWIGDEKMTLQAGHSQTALSLSPWTEILLLSLCMLINCIPRYLVKQNYYDHRMDR